MNVVAKKRTWYMGAFLVVVLVLVAGWMLVVSPVRTASAETREQTAQVDAENRVLEKKVSELRAAFAKIEDLRQEVREDRKRIPTSLELANLLDTLNKVGEDTGVVVTVVTARDVTSVVPTRDAILLPSERAAAEKAKEEAKKKPSSSVDDATANPDADGAGATSKPKSPTAEFSEPKIAGFSALPLSIEIVGSVEQSLAFVDALQGGIERDFMVSVFSTSVGVGRINIEDAPEDALTTVIDGWFYVLESAYDPDAGTAKPEEPTEPAPLPTLGSDNPFIVPED